MNDKSQKYKVKARLLIEGHVQGVGYRTFVKAVARRMNILGVIRNLPDGKVEILCKCKDDDHLNEFIKNIMLSSGEKEYFKPNVTGIKKMIGEEEIKKSGWKKELGLFEIDYGNIEPAQKEILTKLDVGSIMLDTVNENISKRFDQVDNTYGDIGKKLEEISKQLKRFVDWFLEQQERRR